MGLLIIFKKSVQTEQHFLVKTQIGFWIVGIFDEQSVAQHFGNDVRRNPGVEIDPDKVVHRKVPQQRTLVDKVEPTHSTSS